MKKVIKILILSLIFIFVVSCTKKVITEDRSISFDLDGGETSDELFTTFKASDDKELPSASKEGYIFVGWFDGEIFVEKLEDKDYQLKAIFIEPFEYETISETMLFNQEETEYFIYIYRDGCSWCSKIKEDVQKYIYKTSIDSYKSSTKVYVINLTQDGQRSKIFRTYDQDDYDEGFEGFFVNKAKKYDEIYIPSTPALLKVEAKNEDVSVKVLAKGASVVVSEMNKELRVGTEEPEKRKHYSIEYQLNGGSVDGDLINVFYSWSNIILPNPKKEGSIFIGWFENNERITVLDNKDYILEAKWADLVTPEMILASDIFNINEDKYYIMFINEEKEEYDDIVDVSARFNIIFDEKVYFVDILSKENSSIKRSYTGEDGQSSTGRFFVDGVSNWEDLYIPKAFGLIEIETIDGNKVAKFICDGIDCIDFLENLLTE